MQRLDKVHARRNPRIVPFHHDRSAALRIRCAVPAVLDQLPRHRSQALGGCCLLLCPDLVPRRLSSSRLCVEVVSDLSDTVGSLAKRCSYRRTYHPASYHIVQEIQKFNLSDYRPRQEQ